MRPHGAASRRNASSSRVSAAPEMLVMKARTVIGAD
jgi:hypothetical protein